METHALTDPSTLAPIARESAYRLLVEAVVDYAIYLLDDQGRVSSWNPGAERIKGYTRSEILGRHFSQFYTPADRAAGVPAHALAVAREQGRYEADGWRVRKDGSTFWASVIIDPVRDDDGRLIGFAKVTRDMTERRKAELQLEQAREQLYQAQKMEALGKLTGGLAHDFNNLLTVILSGSEMAQRAAGDNTRLAALLEAIESAAQRGARLTRQLLAFARRQPLRPEVIDLSRHLASLCDLVRASMPKEIEVVCEAAEDVGLVEADAGQLDLAVLNLAINARDALQGRGRIRICVQRRRLEGEVEGLCGDFVAVSVADNGPGIDPEIRARIFEPFFTTKELGACAGLGLSQVYGYARQSGGAVDVQSAAGGGATLTVLLPAAARTGQANGAASAAPVRGHGKVLVVEDDPAIAALAIEMVRAMGYEVQTARGASQALRLLELDRFDLVFSDVVMPGGMNGVELARAIRETHPGTPVLLTSGYSEALIGHGEEFSLLPKPYGEGELAAAIGAMLEPASQVSTAHSAG
ncbi:MAG: PAS domain S-box protein [Phenylobacterium sp.]